MIPKFRAWDKEKKMMDIVGGITFDGDEIWEISFSGDCWIDASNYILMQSTGLHDVNGKEIFEGDIVKYWENIGYIEFYQGSWVINWNDGSLFDLYDNDNNLEVLGNIHEHPELLGGNER